MRSPLFCIAIFLSIMNASAQTVAPATTKPAPDALLGSCSTCSSAVCSPCCQPCGPYGNHWVTAEYLFWAAKGSSLPPLISASAPGTARSLAGVTTTPATVVLFGGDTNNNDFRSGLRITAGTWLNCDRTCGLETDFFFLGNSNSSGIAGSSDGSAIVGRPFVNATTGLAAAELVSFPGVLSGSVSAESKSQFIGGGVSFLHNLCCLPGNPCDPCANRRLDLVSGLRFVNLRDDLVIREELTSLGGGAPGSRFLIEDRFHTSNQFYGASIGLSAYLQKKCFYLQARGTTALGFTHQIVDISGSTTIIPPAGAATTYPGGLLTQPTNIGSYSRDRFAIMPELNLRVGCLITQNLRAFVGYNFLYLNRVVRAGDQVDLTVNTTQLAPGALAGPARPAFQFQETDYWVHGISLGAEYRW